MAEATSDIHSDVLWYALGTTLLPLLSFIISLVIPERYSWLVSMKANGLLLGSVFCALKTAQLTWLTGPVVFSTSWFTLAGVDLLASIEFSRTSATMLAVVALISFLVHLYSTGYMAEERNNQRYFAMLGFFTFSMQGLVLSENLLLVFVFWELVGFSSYLLIGHWMERPAAAGAARKAFIMNRIGDLGFITGLMIIWTQTSTFSMSDLVLSTSFEWQGAAALCLFIGVIGKSAQFPLFTWLPDAMEGPTPVSALIHAATMVAAGVYLLVRMAPMFPADILIVVSAVGFLTALLGAIAALFQFDLKRILAYSTMSQLGLMVMALGLGSAEAAFAHLTGHAFFKACLFLSAGSIIHALHRAQQRTHEHVDAQDIRNMGGLKKILPITFATFGISTASLAGIPLTSGFLTKEMILIAAVNSTTPPRLLFAGGVLIISFLTALYSFRMFWYIFLGSPRHSVVSFIRRAPGMMRFPQLLLAAGSLWFVISPNPLQPDGWLWPGADVSPYPLTLISTLWILISLAIAYLLFRRVWFKENKWLLHGYYIDRLYQRSFGKLITSGAWLAGYADRKWVDGLVHATAYAQVAFAHVTSWFDRAVVDGLVTGAARSASFAGAFVRSFQGGKIQLYIFWAILAIIIFLIWMVD